jgi:hypothetical protein
LLSRKGSRELLPDFDFIALKGRIVELGYHPGMPDE